MSYISQAPDQDTAVQRLTHGISEVTGAGAMCQDLCAAMSCLQFAARESAYRWYISIPVAETDWKTESVLLACWQAFRDEAKTVGAAKKAKRAADKAARSPDDVQLTLFQKVG